MESNPSFSYQIVSIIAILIGVPSEYFDSGQYLSSIHEDLSDDPYAVMLRDLCKVRTFFMRNYDRISAEIVYDIKSIDRLSPGLMPNDSIQSLRKAGIEGKHKAGILSAQDQSLHFREHRHVQTPVPSMDTMGVH